MTPLVADVLAGDAPDKVDGQGRSALMLALMYEDRSVVEQLIHPRWFPHSRVKGPANQFAVDEGGRTALFYAAERGDEEIVWLLLSALPGTGLCCQRGSLLQVRDGRGDSAEEWAQRCGNSEIARVLSRERLRIDMFE